MSCFYIQMNHLRFQRGKYNLLARSSPQEPEGHVCVVKFPGSISWVPCKGQDIGLAVPLVISWEHIVWLQDIIKKKKSALIFFFFEMRHYKRFTCYNLYLWGKGMWLWACVLVVFQNQTFCSKVIYCATQNEGFAQGLKMQSIYSKSI